MTPLALLIAAALIAAVAFALGRQTAPAPAVPRLDALAMMPGDHAYILSLRDTADGPAGTVLHSRTDPTSGILTGQAAGTHIADWHEPGTDAARWHADLMETREPPPPLLNDWTDRQGRRHTARLIAVVLPDGTALVKARDETDLVERIRDLEDRLERERAETQGLRDAAAARRAADIALRRPHLHRVLELASPLETQTGDHDGRHPSTA